MLETSGGSRRVATGAPRASADNGKADWWLAFLRGLEEVRTHLEDSVVCHV